MGKRIDRIGQKIGKLTVVSFAFIKNTQLYWNCKCECGGKKTIKSSSLGGKTPTKSCGCLNIGNFNYGWRKKDLTNQRFGRWLVVDEYKREYKDGFPRWNCLCNCGIKKIILGTSLLSGKTQSCGCLRNEQTKITHSTGFEEISGNYFYHLQHRGKRKKVLDFNITLEYIWDLFISQGRKCALSGIELKFAPSQKLKKEQTASLDRIDSSKGYIIGNVQWLHKDVNYMKQDFSNEEFLNYCKLITQKHE